MGVIPPPPMKVVTCRESIPMNAMHSLCVEVVGTRQQLDAKGADLARIAAHRYGYQPWGRGSEGYGYIREGVGLLRAVYHFYERADPTQLLGRWCEQQEYMGMSGWKRAPLVPKSEWPPLPTEADLEG
jgi:hypothetical protein